MAKYVLRNCKLYVAENDLSGDWNSGTIECVKTVPEATAFNSGGRRYCADGLKSNTLNFTGYFETGDRFLLYDNQTVNYAAGKVLTGGTSDAKALIVSDTDWGVTGCLRLTNIHGTFQDNETITDSQGTPGSATSNGTVGEMLIKYDNEAGGPFTVGNTITGVTSGVTGTLVGLQDDVATGKMVISDPSGLYQDNEEIGDGTGTTGDVDQAPLSLTWFPDYGLYSTLGAAETIITVCPTDGTDGEICYASKYVTNYTPIDGTVGDVAGFSVSAQGDSQLMHGYILKNCATAVTGNDDGTAYQLGAVSATQKVIAALHVYEIDGGTLTVKCESDDAEGFPSTIARITFTGATDPTSEWKEVAGAITDDWWRASWIFTGTTAKFIVSMQIVNA